MRGRGTRVWEVIELDADGKVKAGETCVLKDSWVNLERRREGQILVDIRAAAAKLGPESIETTIMNECFLTVITYGDVRVGGQVDKTRHWDLPKTCGAKTVKLGPKACNTVQSSISALGSVTLELMKAKMTTQQHTHFSAKIHHRIVFKEVCTTILDVRSLSEAFRYLSEAVLGKYFLIVPM